MKRPPQCLENWRRTRKKLNPNLPHTTDEHKQRMVAIRTKRPVVA